VRTFHARQALSGTLFCLALALAHEGGAEPENYLQPNSQDMDGTLAYIHFEESDMPLRVLVDMPRQPARLASSKQTREAVLDGMRVWEKALQPVYPWFRLEFVEDDPAARIKIRWRRRLTGDAIGRGWIHWQLSGEGVFRVDGNLEYTTQQCEGADLECKLTADDLRLLVAHEFGHTLGLQHCLECDSIMSYSFETRDRALVTDLDVRTFGALTRIPNGQRVDERRIGAPR
jgi:predicted Zn-dependent protease